MTLLRFIGGPWHGTEREMRPVETGSATEEAFYTDDPGAGFYRADPAPGRAEDHAAQTVPLAVRWHPSALR
ncbi:MAG: hypothetical protein JWO63_2788 [Frankiales bacterium]|jgi:hypothetical protein|nr:hypothetical protein [Frankiales bacterium]